MTDSLPPDLLDNVMDVNAPVVEQWWQGLSEKQRALVKELLSFNNCTVEFLSPNSTIDTHPSESKNQKSFDLFNDDWEDNWEENWRSDWREYLTENPEVSFSFKTWMSGLQTGN